MLAYVVKHSCSFFLS